MRKLLLLRHAKSSWDDPRLADHDRPLNKRGRRAAALVAAALKAGGAAPDLALVSSSLRTRQTWEALAATLDGVPALFEPGLYAAGSGDLLQRLRRLDPRLGSVLLIGHNPGLETLAHSLAAGTGDRAALERMAAKFPTAAWAEIHLDLEDWDATAAGRGRLAAFTRPADLDPAQAADGDD